MADRLNFTPQGAMRATWSVCARTAGRFTGVIKEADTGAWLWHCERALRHVHVSRKEAIACAQERIAKEVRSQVPATLNVTVTCGSCAAGEHMCGGDCSCTRCMGVINGMEPTP